MGMPGLENPAPPNPENIREKKAKEVKVKKVEEVFHYAEAAMGTLVSELKEDIAGRRWDAFLSDDAGARLPSLVIWNIARRYAQERDQTPPKLLFFPGGRVLTYTPVTQEELKLHFQDLTREINGRVLLITEHVSSGDSLKIESKLLEDARLSHDVAVVSLAQWANRDKLELFKLLPQDAKVYLGEHSPREYFYQSDYAGVRKSHRPLEIVREVGADQETIIIVRAKAKELADKLYERYFVKKEQEVPAAA